MGFVDHFATDCLGRICNPALKAAIKDAHLQALLLSSPANLLETTEVYLDLSRRLEKVYVYAHMKNDQDTRAAN